MSRFAPLALSTMWAQRFAPDSTLDRFFEAGVAMGFDRFEIGHADKASAIEALAPGRWRIAAVHHPCPRNEVLSSAAFASPDVAARQASASALHETILLAARLGARAVVLHLGRIDWDPSLSRDSFELVSRSAAGQQGSTTWLAAVDRLRDRLYTDEPAALERAAEAMENAGRLAAREGIALAFETGPSPLDLPTSAGASLLLSNLGAVGAWLDTGHVAAQEEAGVGSFGAWFEAVGDRWLGAHIHDAVGFRDHLAPGTGKVDFSAAISALPDGVALTLEVDWYLTPDEVADGAGRVLAILD